MVSHTLQHKKKLILHLETMNYIKQNTHKAQESCS
jgi:hypothetical protein